jgi:hypothetical protein
MQPLPIVEWAASLIASARSMPSRRPGWTPDVPAAIPAQWNSALIRSDLCTL